MRLTTTRFLRSAAALALLSGLVEAQEWSDDFDDPPYVHGYPVDPYGETSGGNNWESWSSGIGSSTIAGQAPAPAAFSAPYSLLSPPSAGTVNNFNRQAAHPTSGRWVFSGRVYHPTGTTGRSYWLMMSRYGFGGPFSWAVQVYFDLNADIVDCDCAGMNDPGGPRPLARDVWTPIRAEIDLDLDSVDVFYDGASLTGGQTYVWTTGVLGGGFGPLEVQALVLWPSFGAFPGEGDMYWDDLSLLPDGPLGTGDPACTAAPNSTGAAAVIELSGTGLAGELVFASVTGGPPGEFGYFISGPNPGAYVVPPGSSGTLCVAGPQYRYANQVFQFDGNGDSQSSAGGGPVALPTDGSFPPVPAVGAGESRAFQAWYRDGAAGSNFTDSVVVQF